MKCNLALTHFINNINMLYKMLQSYKSYTIKTRKVEKNELSKKL